MEGRLNRDFALFKELYEAHFTSMVSYAFRYTNDWHSAEDIAQNVFIALWRRKAEVDFEKPIKPYLLKATYNLSLNFIHTAQNKTAITPGNTDSIDEMLNREILAYNPHDDLLFEEMKREIDACIDTLPPHCRKVFLLSRNEQMKNREIAAMLHISEKTVEKHITKAIADIRQHLTKMGYMDIYILLIIRQLFGGGN